MENTQVGCTCEGGVAGIQVCTAESVFGPCACGTAGMTGGPATDGGSSSGDTDPSTSGDPSSTTEATSTGEGPSSTTMSTCTVFFGLTADTSAAWQNGAMVGFDAGGELCQQQGADHVCDYEELVTAREQGELDALVDGQTGWVHRTTTAEVDGELSPAGSGGRCINWTTATDDLADGEYFEVVDGAVDFQLDPDTFYDGIDTTHADPAAFPCAGVMRAIPCCNACP